MKTLEPDFAAQKKQIDESNARRANRKTKAEPATVEPAEAETDLEALGRVSAAPITLEPIERTSVEPVEVQPVQPAKPVSVALAFPARKPTIEAQVVPAAEAPKPDAAPGAIAPLADICSTCGAYNRPGVRFCQTCGEARSLGAPAAAPAARDEETDMVHKPTLIDLRQPVARDSRPSPTPVASALAAALAPPEAPTGATVIGPKEETVIMPPLPTVRIFPDQPPELVAAARTFKIGKLAVTVPDLVTAGVVVVTLIYAFVR